VPLIEPGAEFDQLFETFEHTAYRLETRDRYNVPLEAEPIRNFLAGEPDAAYLADWLAMVRRSTAEGRLFSRVRVVSSPLTDYTRFGLWIARYTCEAGDDIRYLARDRAAALPDYDYWLFDSRRLVKMRFTDDDRFTGAEIVEDPAEIVRHGYWRDAARHHAVGRDEFAARNR